MNNIMYWFSIRISRSTHSKSWAIQELEDYSDLSVDILRLLLFYNRGNKDLEIYYTNKVNDILDDIVNTLSNYWSDIMTYKVLRYYLNSKRSGKYSGELDNLLTHGSCRYEVDSNILIDHLVGMSPLAVAVDRLVGNIIDDICGDIGDGVFTGIEKYIEKYLDFNSNMVCYSTVDKKYM
jgi:hypothetical protein